MKIAPGYRLGLLTVVERAGQTDKNVIWQCRCDCGAILNKEAPALRPRGRFKGDRTSCGCAAPAHGHSASKANGGKAKPEYGIWHAMLQRCENRKAAGYPYYGGRGIKVCERWHQFEEFLADMGPRPPGLSIDRFPNNDGNYEPGNCRWATAAQQTANRRPRRTKAQIAMWRQSMAGGL